MPEDPAQIARAKKQLLIIGVVCLTFIILILWVVQLKNTLAYLEDQSSTMPLIQSFKETEKQLGPQWEMFKGQLQNLGR